MIEVIATAPRTTCLATIRRKDPTKVCLSMIRHRDAVRTLIPESMIKHCSRREKAWLLVELPPIRSGIYTQSGLVVTINQTPGVLV